MSETNPETDFRIPDQLIQHSIGWRHPCILETDYRSELHVAIVQNWLSDKFGSKSLCLVSDAKLADETGSMTTTTVSATKFRSLLGQEFDALIYDAFSGFHPDAMVALSGCLRGGGPFIIYAPPLEQWHQFDDPALNRLLAFPLASRKVESHFLRYLRSKIFASACWNRLRVKGQQVVIASSTNIFSKRLSDRDAGSHYTAFCNDKAALHNGPQPKDAFVFSHPKLTEQISCINKIMNMTTQQAAVMVISAGRGRGKSAALGISAARWLQQTTDVNENEEIWVTAPNRDCVSTLFKHAHSEWHLLSPEHHRNMAKRLIFIAPDELLQRLQRTPEKQPRVLLVDEAASLPVHILTQLLLRLKRCLFAATTQGYEGCGQGFRLRFMPALEKLAPAWTHIHLSQPVRWRQDDPLEDFFDHCFMLHATTPPEFAKKQLITTKNLQWQALTPAYLLANTALLNELFQLLITAHYRTTPDDLRTLLDSSEIRIFGVSVDHVIVGCLLLSEESPFTSPELRENIWDGTRRPRGHLLQQSLAQQLNIKAALALPMTRVIRIAVHPDWQRQGIGSWIINNLPDHLHPQSVLSGTSFSSEPGIIRFWQKQGYQLVRLGTKRNAFTGSYATLMIKPVKAAGDSIVVAATTRFTRRFQFDLLRATYPSDLCEEIFSAEKSTELQETASPLDAYDIEELFLFAKGSRPYTAVTDTLYRAALAKWSFPGNPAWQVCIKEQKGLQQAASITGLQGKKAVVKALREATTSILYEIVHGSRNDV